MDLLELGVARRFSPRSRARRDASAASAGGRARAGRGRGAGGGGGAGLRGPRSRARGAPPRAVRRRGGPGRAGRSRAGPGIELQLLAELVDGTVAALRARGRVREETHAQVVVRPAHLRVLGEGGAKLGLRPRVLARVAVGAADEDAGLGDGPRGHDPREEALRLARLLEPQVLGGDEEERLGVLARGDARFAERVRGGVELAGGGPGPREQPEGFHVPRRPESGVGQDLESRGRSRPPGARASRGRPAPPSCPRGRARRRPALLAPPPPPPSSASSVALSTEPSNSAWR